MFHIIISSFVLSVIHASIPNHWLPMVAIGKVERWNKSTTLWATAISGFAHVASTILIGLVVGWAGYKLASSYSYISHIAAPAILVLFGIVYFIRNFIGYHHHHHFGCCCCQESIPIVDGDTHIVCWFLPSQRQRNSWKMWSTS